MAPKNLARWSMHGKHKPPFKAGTAEYFRWYRDVQARARESDLSWPEFYARAKAEAARNPPSVGISDKPVKLFGGALTREYRAWYYRLQCECRALPTHEQNWPEFFKQARAAEEERQFGLGLPPQTLPRWAQAKPAPMPAIFGGSNTPAYRKWYAGLKRKAKFMNLAQQNWKSWFAQHKFDEMERQGLLEPRVRAKLRNVVPLVAVPTPQNVDDRRLMFDFTLPEDNDS
jgi:hypothetical protein